MARTRGTVRAQPVVQRGPVMPGAVGRGFGEAVSKIAQAIRVSGDKNRGARDNHAVTTLIELPIFPLNTVLFPGGRLPLRIFEVRYVDMTKACLRNESPFGVCQILAGREVGQPAAFAPVGCTARIAEWEVPTPGLFNLVTRGEGVFRVLDHHVQPDGLIRAQVLLEAPREPQALPPSRDMLGRMLREIIAKIGPQHFEQPARVDDAAWVAYRLAEILPLSREQKLQLLQERDAGVVLEQIERAVLGVGS